MSAIRDAAMLEADKDDGHCPSCMSDKVIRLTPTTPGPDGWGYRCKKCGTTWNISAPDSGVIDERCENY